MLKAYKYRIYPNKKQIKSIVRTIGCCRYIYNKGLETKIRAYQMNKKSLSCFDLMTGFLIEEKKNKKWLEEPNAQCLQASLRNLDNAFTRFFKEKKGFPKFKKK